MTDPNETIPSRGADVALSDFDRWLATTCPRDVREEAGIVRRYLFAMDDLCPKTPEFMEAAAQSVERLRALLAEKLTSVDP